MTGIKTRPDNWINPFPKSFYSGEENAPDNIWQPIFSQNTLNGLGHDAFEAGAETLIELGCRLVPSTEEIADRLVYLSGKDSGLDRDYFIEDAREIRRWLLDRGVRDVEDGKE